MGHKLINGHEYVDLGLPSGTLWATCNVGASSPEEFGDYFAWGEITPKVIYYWDTYKYISDSDGFTHIRKCAAEGIDDFMAHVEKLRLEIFDDTDKSANVCANEKNEERLTLLVPRSEADSNRCTRFCRPLPSHSAIRPTTIQTNTAATLTGPVLQCKYRKFYSFLQKNRIFTSDLSQKPLQEYTKGVLWRCGVGAKCPAYAARQVKRCWFYGD